MGVDIVEFWQTALLGVFSFGFTFWIKSLHSTINRLWEENRQMYTVFQLKADALRDQEQIMSMLSEIKQSIERMNDRIDRRTDATGALMAHPKAVRDAVRRDYIAQGIAPEVLRPMHGVSVASVIRWRRESRENGDNWDKQRAARRLSSGVPEDITRELLLEFLEHHKHAMEQLRKAREGADGQAAMPADDYASLLAKLQDGFNKMIAASKRILPETDRLIVAVGVVEDLAAFISDKYPALMADFLDVLPEFQQIVEKKIWLKSSSRLASLSRSLTVMLCGPIPSFAYMFRAII